MTFDYDFKVTTFYTLNILHMTQDKAIVTIERQLVVCILSTGDSYIDINRPVTWFSRSRHFKLEYVENGTF